MYNNPTMKDYNNIRIKLVIWILLLYSLISFHFQAMCRNCPYPPLWGYVRYSKFCWIVNILSTSKTKIYENSSSS